MLANALERWIEEQEWIGQIAEPVQRAVQGALKQAPAVAKMLHGDRIGHPLQSAMTEVPIGAFTCAAALDALGALGGGRLFRRGADASVAIGLAGTLAAVVPELADWSETRGGAARVGAVHATAHLGVVGLYGASLGARLLGLRKLGIALSTAGLSLARLRGRLGGEPAFQRGVGLRPEACARGGGVHAPGGEEPVPDT